jgi:hypothetical protein
VGVQPVVHGKFVLRHELRRDERLLQGEVPAIRVFNRALKIGSFDAPDVKQRLPDVLARERRENSHRRSVIEGNFFFPLAIRKHEDPRRLRPKPAHQQLGKCRDLFACRRHRAVVGSP